MLEVLIAIVLFTVAILVSGRVIVEFVHQAGISEVQAQAVEFAMQELERVRLLPYDEIVSRSAAPVPEAPQFRRRVDVAVFGEDLEELYAYRLITVTVEPPRGLRPVGVSTAVAE
ncbi:MAG: hypothetical protein PVG79_00110 [Gemmatimonadales bacterium]